MTIRLLRVVVIEAALMLLTTTVAHAALIVTTIQAEVVSISGLQLPTQLFVNDNVTFVYEYDDAGIEAHTYYTDGSVASTSGLSPDGSHSEPFLALSDAKTTFSFNLLSTFGEFTGTSGYQATRVDWVLTEMAGSRIFLDWIAPSVGIYMGYNPSVGLTAHNEGRISLWQANQVGVTTIWVDFTSVENVAVVPEPSTIALIGMALLSLFGFGYLRNRQAQ